MPQVDPEQLEKEADELIKSLNAPPADPDTENGKGAVPAEEDEGGGDEPKPGASDEPNPQDTPTDTPEEPSDTGLDGLTLENARERIRNAQSRMHRATQEAADLRKKFASQDRELKEAKEKLNQLQRELESLKDKPPAKPESAPVVDSKELQAIAEEYPSIAGPFIKVIDALTAKLTTVESELSGVKGAVAQTASEIRSRDEKSDAEKHFSKIREAHPDAFDLVDSDDFNGWLDRQPPMFREIIDHGSADDVIYVFDTYKEAVGVDSSPGGETPSGKPDTRDRLSKARAAADPAPRKVRIQPLKQKGGKPTFTRKQIREMSPEEYEKREAEIDEAMADGRIVE